MTPINLFFSFCSALEKSSLCLGITRSNLIFYPQFLLFSRLDQKKNNFVYGVHYLMLGTLGTNRQPITNTCFQKCSTQVNFDYSKRLCLRDITSETCPTASFRRGLNVCRNYAYYPRHRLRRPARRCHSGGSRIFLYSKINCQQKVINHATTTSAYSGNSSINLFTILFMAIMVFSFS